MPNTRTTGLAKVLAVTIAAVTMLLGGLTLGSIPDAEAQSVEVRVDITLRAADPCPDDTTNVGSIVGDGEAGKICRPNGYVPLTDASLCEGLTGEFETLFLAGVCARIAVEQSRIAGGCPSVWPLDSTTFDVPVCVVPFLVAGGAGNVSAGTPVCIESDMVQNDEAAADLQVGSQYVGSDGVRYLIATGGPTCTFNCHMGFDSNSTIAWVTSVRSRPTCTPLPV